jgi:hypothetical protein
MAGHMIAKRNAWIVLLILPGCLIPTLAKQEVQLRENSEEMRNEVLRFVSIGMPVGEAIETLEAQGFQVRDLKEITFSKLLPNKGPLRSFNTFNWVILVRLYEEDNKVKDVKAHSIYTSNQGRCEVLPKDWKDALTSP